ncbi:hypothetical protein GQX73_g4916 [Xylaria multiplex]|uniref:Pali-domain-containing protein n=1 Tax=Xylaria multiplex TaxID=323545 RepID=A0A7C8ITH5_9PEZI|nr:hypothetical protein GQX73_g4916 [Xylaria multiplex]
MAALKGESESLQPWYRRRASARGIPAHGILLILSFVLIILSLALFIVVDVTAPAVVDMALFKVRNRGISYNGDNAVLTLGTFGYCINWTPSDTDTTDLTTQLPICYRGNDYTTAAINRFFSDTYIPFGYIARLTPALTALHPLITVLVFLVLVTAVLPCFIPLFFSVVLSWLAAASSIAAVGCTFSLALVTRSSLASHYEYVFGYGTAIWALLVGAISIWVFTALLTTAWWLRRRSTRRNSAKSPNEPGSVHRVPDMDASVESQDIGVPGEAARKELPQEEHTRSHELFDTDIRQQSRAESGAEERHEIGTPERSKPQA